MKESVTLLQSRTVPLLLSRNVQPSIPPPSPDTTRSITLVLTLVPQGRLWLDKHQTQLRAALHRNRNNETYKRLMEFVPYKFGVCRDYASLLATRDCALIKSVLGLGALRQIDRGRVEIFVRDALTRGARPSGGGGRTNRCYWPRQLAYLEFVHDKLELQVTLEDLALEMGKTTEEASVFVDIGDDLISFVNEKSAVAFLEHVKKLRETPVSPPTSLSIMDSCFRHWIVKMKIRRRIWISC